MGVHGLWRLIEPSGKPVPLETLENKTLAVDVSIWLHQAIKGFQDSKGEPLPNAHLLGVYHRICKLLYFRIRPIFVFDGGVPNLKKETIAKRNQLKNKNLNEAGRLHKQLLNTLLKHSAVSKVLSEKAKASIEATSKDTADDMFALPSTVQYTAASSSSSDDESETTDSSPTKQWDLHTIDVHSKYFKSLPADVKHDILTELKETRKQSSWGRLHELPTQSDDFASFQMRRLLKRYSVQTSLEEVEQEMGGHSLSLGELESLLNEQGVLTKDIGKRIASDENTRYLLIKKTNDDVKLDNKVKFRLETIEENESEEELIIKDINEGDIESKKEESNKIIPDLEYERDLQKAIALSLQDEPSTSSQATIYSLIESDSDDSIVEVPKIKEKNLLASAKSYMMEYSGLTPNEISKILNNNSASNKKCSKGKNFKKIEVLHKISEEQKTIDHHEPASSTKTADDHDEVEVNQSNDDLQILHEKQLETNEIIKDLQNQKEISIEIPKNAVVTSESDSDDFLDVSNETENKLTDTENALQIVIKPCDKLDDDIFSDIFANEAQNSEENKNTEEAVNKEVVTENKEESITKVIEELLPSNRQIEGEKTKLSVEDLQEIEANLRKETKTLAVERSTKERLAGNITDQMYQEAQELLELFGVPYIIAPMEAEAQCAFLDEVNLTDGTITDDSDIWLFGGKTVYKNFFDQKKHVMEFRAENIQHYFKLTREQMILLALLVGSDYTTGIQGVGPVTALEILAAFPPTRTTEVSLSHYQLLSGLSEFRSWFLNGRNVGPGRTTLRNKLKNIFLSENFPSFQVIKAYLEPKIETSKEKFSWSKPDLVGLIDFAREKFGWNRNKSEEILKPILKRLEETYIQKSIKDYFQTKHKIDSIEAESKMSKRVKKAVSRIGKEKVDSDEDDLPNKKTKKRRKTKVQSEKTKNLSSDEDVKVLKTVKTRSQKKIKEIENNIQDTLQKVQKTTINLHKKEVISQKEIDKQNSIRNKLKAIEVFRKSTKGPGYIKKRQKLTLQPKEDAELSESSSD